MLGSAIRGFIFSYILIGFIGFCIGVFTCYYIADSTFNEKYSTSLGYEWRKSTFLKQCVEDFRLKEIEKLR